VLKNVLCIALCMLIMIFTIFNQYQEVQAFVPLVIAGVTIAPEVVAAGATLLCAAGITFASSPDAQRSFAEMYVSASTGMRDAFNALGTGVRSIGDSLWNYTRSWANKKFVTPNTTVNVDYSYHETEIGEIGSYGQVFPYSLDKNVVFPIGDTWRITQDCTIGGVACKAGDYMWLEKVLYSGSTYNFKPVVNGTVINTFAGSNTFCDITAGYTFYIYRTDGKYKLGFQTVYQGQVKNYDLSNQSMISFNTLSQVHYETISAQTMDIVGNETYDFKTAEGRRDIKVPATVDDVVGKTYQDVQNPTEVQPTAAPTSPPTQSVSYPNTWTGAFKDAAPSMGQYTFEGTGTIVGEMDYSRIGIWEGEWSWTATGERVWTGTYTDADAKTWTGTATEASSNISTDGEINWEPLKVAGNLFTNKFPFSLPWDLKRSFSTLVSSNTGQPDFTFNFYTKLTGYVSFTVDLSMWSGVISASKILELMAFDIGLILLTRKLLGGAT